MRISADRARQQVAEAQQLGSFLNSFYLGAGAAVGRVTGGFSEALTATAA
jgi:hypothetical protein